MRLRGEGEDVTDKAIILRAKHADGMYVARIEFAKERTEEIAQVLRQAGFEVEIRATPVW